MREFNKITKRVVTRYYVNGKGYNSEADALCSIGRNIVRRMKWDYRRARLPFERNRPWDDYHAQSLEIESAWMKQRYPCECKSECAGLPCLTARRRDYKRLGQMFIEGKIDSEGRSTEILALPARCA